MPLSTPAPIKLPYVCALARQMLLATHINVDASNTGLLPKVVLNGTLSSLSTKSCPNHDGIDNDHRDTPDKVTKTKHQNTNASELHHTREIRVEGLDELWKHGRGRQRTHALIESNGRRTRQGRHLPEGTPVLLSKN